jgi:hypothetical protein
VKLREKLADPVSIQKQALYLRQLGCGASNTFTLSAKLTDKIIKITGFSEMLQKQT